MSACINHFSLLLLNSTQFYENTILCISIHLGNLDCFKGLTIKSKVGINIVLVTHLAEVGSAEFLFCSFTLYPFVTEKYLKEDTLLLCLYSILPKFLPADFFFFFAKCKNHYCLANGTWPFPEFIPHLLIRILLWESLSFVHLCIYSMIQSYQNGLIILGVFFCHIQYYSYYYFFALIISVLDTLSFCHFPHHFFPQELCYYLTLQYIPGLS